MPPCNIKGCPYLTLQDSKPKSMFSFPMPFLDHQGCYEPMENQKKVPPRTAWRVWSMGWILALLQPLIQVPLPSRQSAQTYDPILLTISLLGLYFAFQLKCLGLSNLPHMEELGQKCRARIKGSELEYEKMWWPKTEGLRGTNCPV